MNAIVFGESELCSCKGKGCYRCDYEGVIRPRARRTDPETSHKAAIDATAKAGTNRRKAYDTLSSAGLQGLTDFELATRTHIAQTSIGVRRKELVRAGLVEDSGMRRPAPSGSMAIVWRVIH